MISQTIRQHVSAHPALIVGIALGVGTLLGVALSSRDKRLVLDLAHLVTRIALAGTRTL